MRIPRLIISGLSGGAGKTMLSLGLARAFSRAGVAIRAFKKGPDYIDAAWLARAARAPQGNLDPFFSPGAELLRIFTQDSKGCELALIEGNRGIFDGLDMRGSCSTSEVSRILQAPVLLILDCTKMTRTVAAVVKGCLAFEENLHIGGVILNRTGNQRHRDMVRHAVEEFCGVPVFGVLPRRNEPFIFERHMGLAGMDEMDRIDPLLDSLADFIEAYVDISGIRKLADAAPPLPELPAEPAAIAPEPAGPVPQRRSRPPASSASRPRIGYVHDAALWFYYRENLDALCDAGARLVPLSLLDVRAWPEIDGLYLGGGVPEMHVRELSENTGARARVAELSCSGLPIYAECGGFMYLARTLVLDHGCYPMAGVFPVSVRFYPRPRGLGYVEAQVVAPNPFHPVGTRLRGHEFHFSGLLEHGGGEDAPSTGSGALSPLLRLDRGKGMFHDAAGIRYDGLLTGNTFASYTHIYAPALPWWGVNFVSLCRKRTRL